MTAEISGRERSDEDLVRQVQGGDAEAFALVYRRHNRRIARFLRTVGVPEADVEDMLGETFCRALDKIDQFNPDRGKRYLSYLYSIARNLAVDRVRYRPRILSLEDLQEGWDSPDGGAEDPVVEEICRLEQVATIRRAMERLSTADREILVLAYDRELSSREIMEVTGKPSITSVTTHVYKAMKKLRECVAEAVSGPGVRQPDPLRE